MVCNNQKKQILNNFLRFLALLRKENLLCNSRNTDKLSSPTQMSSKVHGRVESIPTIWEGILIKKGILTEGVWNY